MNPIQQLLEDLFTTGLDIGAREVKRAARRKHNRNVRPALDIIGEFFEAARKESTATRRRSLHPPIVDRQKPPGASTSSPPPARVAAKSELDVYLEKAAGFLSLHSGVPAHQILLNRAARDRAYREAAKRLHPDQGGDETTMQELTAYWRVLRILNEVPNK